MGYSHKLHFFDPFVSKRWLFWNNANKQSRECLFSGGTLSNIDNISEIVVQTKFGVVFFL